MNKTKSGRFSVRKVTDLEENLCCRSGMFILDPGSWF